MMGKDKKPPPRPKINLLTGGLLVISLFMLIGIVQIPQELRQRAQRIPAAPQCMAAANNTGVCDAAGSCLTGEEDDLGQLDCQTGQTCCGLAPVPSECAAASPGGVSTFCSTEANCTTLYAGTSLGQMDCADGVICCNNPNAPTFTPVPTPTFGSISVPSAEPTEEPIVEPTEVQTPPTAPPPAHTPTPQQGLLQFFILIITFILGLLIR